MSDTMKIRFVKGALPYRQGDEATFSTEAAQNYIRAKVAVPVKTATPEGPDEDRAAKPGRTVRK